MACPSSLLNGTDFEEIACKWPACGSQRIPALNVTMCTHRSRCNAPTCTAKYLTRARLMKQHHPGREGGSNGLWPFLRRRFGKFLTSLSPWPVTGSQLYLGENVLRRRLMVLGMIESYGSGQNRC